MLSSPEVIIEGDHDYGDDLMMDMACWLCNHLLPDVGYEIVITFRKFDPEEDGDEHANHIALDIDSHEITINNELDLQDAMIALTHEMIHVQQYMKGLLKEDRADMYWRGKHIPNNTPYLDRPWEKHARRNELRVYKTYLRTLTQTLH